MMFAYAGSNAVDCSFDDLINAFRSDLSVNLLQLCFTRCYTLWRNNSQGILGQDGQGCILETRNYQT